MNRIGSAFLVVLVAGTGAVAGSPDPAPSPADRLAAIQKEYQAAEDEFRKAVEALPDTPEGQKKEEELFKVYDKGQADRFMAAVDLAKAAPESDAGFAALEWVLTTPRAYYQPAGKEAMELVTAHHAANPKVGKIIAWVGWYRPRQGDAQDAAAALIDAVAAKNPDKTARGQAFLAIALEAQAKFGAAEYQKAADVDKRAADAEKAFEAVLKDYGACPRLIRDNAGTLGEIAQSALFDLQHLRIGLAAPDIEGEDLDGTKFKLSDYRGKVVVIDFWGDW